MNGQQGMPNDPILRAAMLTQMQNQQLTAQPDVATMEADMAAKRQAEQKKLAGKSAEAQEGGEAGEAGEKLTTAGFAAQTPYVAGAGIALQGFGMVDDAKRQNEQAQIDAYNNKIMAQRSAIRNIFA